MLRISMALCLCIAAAALFIVPVVNAETETLEKTYDVNPGTRFEIINHDGGIEITGWDQNRIDIHAVKKTRWGGKNLQWQNYCGRPGSGGKGNYQKLPDGRNWL